MNNKLPQSSLYIYMQTVLVIFKRNLHKRIYSKSLIHLEAYGRSSKVNILLILMLIIDLKKLNNQVLIFLNLIQNYHIF